MANVTAATSKAVKNLESMWDRIDSVRTALKENYVDERPADSFTAREYCRRFNLPGATGQHQLESLIRRGIIKRFRTTIPDGMGRAVVQNCFVLAGEK